MRILVVGGGGREHALAWRLSRYGHDLCFTHVNPGFSSLGTSHLADPVDVAREQRVDLVVVGPEGPLAEGLVDRLVAAGIPAFGPRRNAAWLESSKADAKAFFQRHRLPTARAVLLSSEDTLAWNGGGVVKLDGLAGGKGVWVCEDAASLRSTVDAAFRARPKERLVIEERLVGPEVSVLGISDGKNLVPLLAARDHKRRYDGDLGPNTGGMGAVAPVQADARCVEVLRKAVTAMADEGTPFRGVLYGGFMLTADGPKLLEFNVRFGDPECQPLMALLDEDPAPWFLGAATGQLPGDTLRWRGGAACCVVVCGEEYPARGADAPITRLPADDTDLVVFHAGTRRNGNELRAAGGRVLGVTGLGEDLPAARARAYAAVAEVEFAGAAWRTDIGLAPS